MRSKGYILIIAITLLVPINIVTYALEASKGTEIGFLSETLKKSRAELAPPTFSDAVYRQRIKDISGEVPLTFNKYVRNFIDAYTIKHRNKSEKIIGRASTYFPIFEEILRKENAPLDLKYLAIIESALSPVALSKAGAKGLWQFMPATGKMFGLDQNETVDERCETYLATEAAARYLLKMNKRFDNWMLSIAAYNCGPGRVNKAIKRAGSKDIWKVYQYLPRETRGYVPAFIAVAYMMNYYNEHGLYPEYPDYDLQNLTATQVFEHLKFQEISDRTGMSVDDIRYLNPAFLQDYIPTNHEGYHLYLPQAQMAYFTGQRSIPTYEPPAPIAAAVIVPPKPKRVIPAGEKIYISKELNLKVEEGELIVYEFQKGDNLWEIARKYPGVSSKDIIELNKIEDYRKLRPGVQLLINPKS